MSKKTISLMMLIVFFACSEENIDIERGECTPFSFSDTYTYPIRPGTEQWKQLNSLAKKVEACQIPDGKLRSISTGGLLETCLNYPLLLDYGAFDQMQNGFNRVKNENNGFIELYKRADNFKVLTGRYQQMSLNCDIGTYPPFPFEGFAAPMEIAFEAYEFFLFQDELLNDIDVDKKDIIFGLVYDKYLLKVGYGFFPRDKLVSVAILGKIMYQNNFTPFVDYCEQEEFIKFFIDKIPVYRPENIRPTDIIIEFAEQYIANR
jgi:hypothetical protein